MAPDWQTFAALFVVALACVYLLLTLLRKRKSPGCGSDCGCPSDQFKSKLRSEEKRRANGEHTG